jgi:hypothetical protein
MTTATAQGNRQIDVLGLLTTNGNMFNLTPSTFQSSILNQSSFSISDPLSNLYCIQSFSSDPPPLKKPGFFHSTNYSAYLILCSFSSPFLSWRNQDKFDYSQNVFYTKIDSDSASKSTHNRRVKQRILLCLLAV